MIMTRINLQTVSGLERPAMALRKATVMVIPSVARDLLF